MEEKVFYYLKISSGRIFFWNISDIFGVLIEKSDSWRNLGPYKKKNIQKYGLAAIFGA